MVDYKNWCVKLQLNGSKKDRLEHPVIDYLNRTYRKDHDGTAYYYGVYDNDTFYDNSEQVKESYGKQAKHNIPILTLEEFEMIILQGIIPDKAYELW